MKTDPRYIEEQANLLFDRMESDPELRKAIVALYDSLVETPVAASKSDALRLISENEGAAETILTLAFIGAELIIYKSQNKREGGARHDRAPS